MTRITILLNLKRVMHAVNAVIWLADPIFKSLHGSQRGSNSEDNPLRGCGA